MAGELGVEVERLVVPREEDGKALRADLTGAWFGLFLSTDRFGHPCVIDENVQLTQIDDTVEGRLVYRENNEAMIDVFENAQFKDNVLCGQIRSEKWPFPLECGAFVLSGGRDLTWLDGYLSWFDLDSEQTQFSKYVLIRTDCENFETELKNAYRLMSDESKLLRTRRFLKSGYNFETSLSLVTASQEQNEDTTSANPGKATSAVAINIPSQQTNHIALAVANFSVDGSEPSQQFFADGLVDDIATELVSTSNMNVLPRSIFPKDAQLQPEDAAKRGATHVLSGSIRRSHDKLWINAQLIDTDTSRVVWAERYTHSADAAFAMYNVIVSDISCALNQSKVAEKQLLATDTINAQAYELFLKARSLYHRGMYVHSLRAAEAILLRAIEMDRNFARSHAQLSICRTYLMQSIQVSNKNAIDFDGFSDAETALRLNPELPLAHAAIGLAHYAAGDFRGRNRNC